MTIENLYDALEFCLNALEQGADIESCLVRFPDLADELRPILETAVQARVAAVEDVPADVMRRGKARVLQAAAEMREQEQRKPVLLPFWRRRSGSARTFRLTFTMLVVVLFLLTGGTGLVNASSGALPGDNLYSVKRTWEGVRLQFTFNEHEREKLEVEFEDERVREIGELFDEDRFEQVNFQGIVQSQQGEIWLVDEIMIKVSDDAVISDGVILGSVVQVIGETDDGVIEAEQINLIKPPVVTFTPSPTRVRSTETPRPTKAETESPKVEESSPDGPEASDAPEVESTEMDDSDDDRTKTPEPTRTRKPSDSGSGQEDNSGGQDNSNDSDSDGDDNSGSGGGDDNSGSDDENSDGDSSGDDNSGSGGGD